MKNLISSFKAHYVHARTQMFLLGLVCFAGPGMFNSLNALGGAGQSDPTVANNTNTVCISLSHYSPSASSLFAPSAFL